MATAKSIHGQRVGTSATVLFANPAGKKSYIKNITFSNNDTIDRGIVLWIAPADSGSIRTVTEGDIYQLSPMLVKAKDTSSAKEIGFVFENDNDAIIAVAEIADKINAFITYSDITPVEN